MTGSLRIDLELVVSIGSNAQKAFETSLLPLSMQTFTNMKSVVGALKGNDVGPTVNVARYWAMASGFAMFDQDRLDKWVEQQSMLKPLTTADEELSFDVDDPQMSFIVPTEEDESGAIEADGKEADRNDPDSIKEASLDANTLKFGPWWVANWANNSIFDTLAASVQKGMELMRVWLAYHLNRKPGDYFLSFGSGQRKRPGHRRPRYGTPT